MELRVLVGVESVRGLGGARELSYSVTEEKRK